MRPARGESSIRLMTRSCSRRRFRRRSALSQALCLNVEVLSTTGEQIEMRELDEDVFRTAEELGIDLSRPERGTDEEDEQRRQERM